MAGRAGTLRQTARGASTFAGMREVQDKIAAILDRTTGQAVKKVYMKGAMLIVEDARARVPVRTGRLRSAIFADEGEPSKSNVIVGVQYFLHGDPKKARAPHAHLIEFGTVKMAARPFMRPAIAAKKGEVAKVLKDGLLDIIASAAK